jgi:glycine/D-amino acid oxidase-like deaminating enzyme
MGNLPGMGSKVVRAQDVEWAREADVVVIGSGTGQLAAIRAAANGLSAIVLDSAQFSGGTTGLSGGGSGNSTRRWLSGRWWNIERWPNVCLHRRESCAYPV